jgi:hypothetical protein
MLKPFATRMRTHHRDWKESPLVTWVLSQEPDELIARVIEIVERRLENDPDEVSWMCADVPAIETIGE